LGVKLAVDVRDQFQGDVVNARLPGGGAVDQTRQFPAVAARQMPAGGANLLFDQMIVVEKPLGGGSDAPAALDGVGDQVVCAGQHRFVVRKT
jgi:hypothetical protein